MGVNNRQRRAAAKAKRRTHGARRHDHREGADRSRSSSPRADPVEAVRILLAEAATNDDEEIAQHLLDALRRVDQDLLDTVVEAQLLRSLDLLWRNGWQPFEIVRHARRTDARAGRLVAAAVVADHVLRPASSLHPRWQAQVAALVTPPVTERTGWLRGVVHHEQLPRPQLIAHMVAALRAVCEVGPIQQLLAPPGDGVRQAATSDTRVDAGVLVKVRALLAQAESTTYEAEAEAFTAKAEELMARHALDEALVWAASERRDRPISIRVPIDDPYADIKSLLLQHVARHARCRAVWQLRYSWSSVVGFPTDVAATELLFTSLLVQSAAAMQSAATSEGPGGRARSRSFRSSFLIAFTQRIDERLDAIARAAEAAADDGSSTLLPALIAREDAVDAELDAMFSTLTSNAVRGGRDAAGWARGRLAADLAQLNAGDLRGAPD